MNTLVNRLFIPLVITGTVIAALVTTANPAYAVPECPTIAAVSAAVGSTATDSDLGSCEFKVGDDTISFQIDASTNIDADLAARRSDAIRRTARVAKTKAGKYAAFTGASTGYSQLYYNQKGTTIKVSHFEINGQSSDILKKASAALAKIKIPAEINSCTAITKAVVAAVPTAKFKPGQPGGCGFTLADATSLFVGIQDDPFAEWLDTYEYTTSDRPPIIDTTVGKRKGFTWGVALETNLVLPLDDAIATVTLQNGKPTPQQKALLSKAAAVIA